MAAVLAACGGVLAAAVNTIAGIAMIGAGVIALIAAALNAAKCKKGTGSDELKGRIRALLGREGKSCEDEKEYLSALIGIKAKKEAELEQAEERAAGIRSDTDRMLALEEECKIFLDKFNVTAADPYLQIRQNLSDYDYLSERVKELTAEVAHIVREYGVNVERLNRSQDVIAGESADALKPALEEELRRLRGEAVILERECKREREEIGRLDELAARRAEMSEKLADSEKRLEVINLTKEHLTKAKDSLTVKYLEKTREAFAEYMTLIGNEQPELFTMDTSFGITRSEGGQSKPTEAYSLGTRDFFTLAARLALVKTLYDGELPFVILDDPFAHFDDKKCATALKVLKRISEKNQIVYLTCSKSRAI